MKVRVESTKNWHIGIIQKEINSVSYELKPRDFEGRLFAFEQLLERKRQKRFLFRIVPGIEKRVYYDISERR